MAGFGEKLRNAREKKGFSIETIEDETKIRKVYLEALEQEDFALLPPRVYAIGFVKRYALLLNLDAEELTREFKELAYGAGEEAEPPVLSAPPEKSSMLIKIPVKNLFVAVAFLLVAIWAGNFLLDCISNSLSKHQIGKTPSVNEKNQPNTTSVNPPASKTLDMVVKVKPNLKCWVLVRVDGEETFEKIMTSAQQQSFSAKKSIYIKVGNAGAIDILLNNKKIDPLGGPGQVEEKEFKYGSKY